MMRNCLLYQQQVEYLEQIQVIWKGVDEGWDDEEAGLSIKRSVPWYHLLSEFDDNTVKFPSISSLPRWEIRVGIDKESKLWLCQEAPPSLQAQQRFSERTKEFFAKHGIPAYLRDPPEEEVVALTSKKYLIKEK